MASTTGYATADYDLWPAFAARPLICVADVLRRVRGFHGGRLKICRIAMLWKQALRSVRHNFQPRKVQSVRFEGKGVDENVLRETSSFAIVYVALILLGAFLISLEGKYDLETNLASALTCVSNVGPGLGATGPAGGFAGYGPFTKLVLSILMLAGRLKSSPSLPFSIRPFGGSSNRDATQKEGSFSTEKLPSFCACSLLQLLQRRQCRRLLGLLFGAALAAGKDSMMQIDLGNKERRVGRAGLPDNAVAGRVAAVLLQELLHSLPCCPAWGAVLPPERGQCTATSLRASSMPPSK